MKIFIKIFILLSFILNAQNKSNSLKVTYGFLNHSEEIKNDQIYKQIAKDTYKEAYTIAENVFSFELICKEKESIFFKNELILQETYSLLVDILLKTLEKKFFYRNENQFIYTFDFFGQNYLVEVPKLKDIVITNESKLINNYNCYKATCYDEISNQNVIVWFTPELNLNKGPSIFHDFPGLVLEINYKYYSIICKNIKFELDQNDIDKIKKPKGLHVTREELLKNLERTKEGLRKN
jgi:GLPGLI family protein